MALEIVRSLDRDGSELWSALVPCCDTYHDENGITQLRYTHAYTIYGEPTRKSLVGKLNKRGYAIQ